MKHPHADAVRVTRTLVPGYYGPNDRPRYTWTAYHRGYRPPIGTYRTRAEAERVALHQQTAARATGWTPGSVESPREHLLDLARRDRAAFDAACDAARTNA